MLSVRSGSWIVVLGLALGGFGTASTSLAAEAGWSVVIDPGNSFAFNMRAADQIALQVGLTGWGPGWSWFSLNSNQKGIGDRLNIAAPLTIGGNQAKLGLNVVADGTRSAVYTYTISADKDVPLLAIVATINVPEKGKGSAVLSMADGSEQNTDLPLPFATTFGVVKKMTITGDVGAGPVVVTFDPPLEVGGDQAIRVTLAKDAIKAGSTTAKMTWTFPGDTSLLFSNRAVMSSAPAVTTPDWFVYNPTWNMEKSAIGAEDWLDKPAGKHGGVRMEGNHFILQDGTRIKFWGTNLAYGDCAPPSQQASFTAKRFAKYGINAVRLHKFTGVGWEGIGDANDSTRMNFQGLNRFDYFTSQLAANGVYYGWSHTYMLKVKPGDRSRISGYDELMKKGGNTYAVINWAEDVQDLLIDSVINLLKHTNRFTGKTYAEDPALSYIELQNEDDIFFWTTVAALTDFPTYKAQLQKHFDEWLTTKYGSQDKLADAWNGAIADNETLGSGNIDVKADLYQMSEKPLAGNAGGQRQRFLDTAAFLHFTQNKFYSKFVKRIREAGYQGPLVGSPWQAPSGLPDLYNLRSDYLVGYIDRHNYSGGGFNDSILPTPGGGYLSSGLEQVADRPFGISEWITCYPALYSAEGPVLMAAYGFGLQGWSASYEFTSTSFPANNVGAIVGNAPFGIWNADAPTQLGQSPILSRMIMRGDVKMAPVISTRRISPQDLETGNFNFSDDVQQQGDVKAFGGSVPPESLAAGRAVVEFVDRSTPSIFPDMARYQHGTAITSATGQLKWDTADGGVVTINTPGTQGYVGFASGKRLMFNNLSITPATHYASILITAADPKENLANARRVLISAIARNSNKGFRISRIDYKSIVDNGTGPIMLEPVKADIAFASHRVSQVNILDFDGRPTGRTVPISNGSFSIDTGRDTAMYYELVMEQ
jgi:hypothetical protein